MPEPRARQRRRPIEEWRPVILDGALRVIINDGIRALSMERLSREVRLAKPRIYAAFSSLDQVLVELYNRETAVLRTEFDAVLAAIRFDPDVTDSSQVNTAAQLIVSSLLRSAHEHPDAWRLAMITGPDAPEVLVKRNEAARDWTRRHLAAFLAVASISTPRLADLDADLGARAIVVLGEDAVRMTMADPVEYGPDRFVALARWMFTALDSAPSAD